MSDRPEQTTTSAAERQRAALKEALGTILSLREENRRLRDELAAVRGEQVQLSLVHAGCDGSEPEGEHIDANSPAELKLALFRGLFRGREDVYAVRWERLDGRSGYAPALRFGAPRGRGVEHDPGDYLALTPAVVRSHLTGGSTIGIYPLLQDDTCWLLAIDFDKAGWRQDALATLEVCDGFGIPAALERSRSGEGAHLWVFFAKPVAAFLARNLGSAMLTQALDRRYQIGLDSYDRLFPSQDTLPKGGFGNLIALPLQRQSREQGNTVFLDRDLEPYSDQWRFLSSVRKLEPAGAESIVQRAARAGRIVAVDYWVENDDESEPWKLPPSRRKPEPPIPGPLPASMSIVAANRLFVDKKDLPPYLMNRLRRLAAFQNPEFYRAQRMRLSTFGKPRLIDCSEDFSDHLALPRGCLSDVLKLARENGVRAVVTDKRDPGTPITTTFKGELTARQQAVAEALAGHDVGVLSAPTAFGKTVIAAWLIAQRGVNTLVLVHRQHLLDQWRERLAAFLDLPPKAIGQFGAGKRRPTGILDVVLVQSLSRRGEVHDLVSGYGQVVVDECHHVPAFSFEKVMREVHGRFVVGLTATPVRKDGHHPIIAMQCGPIRCKVHAKEQAAARPFEHEVIVRRTDFTLPTAAEDAGIQDVYSRLVADEGRTALVVSDVLKSIRAGRSPLILTERTGHLEKMAALIEPQVRNVVVLRGGLATRERRRRIELLASIPDDQPRVLLATGRYIGEGFDDARLDTLFLTLPVSWRGTVQQYAGRLHRLHPSKRVVQIFDYADSHVPMLLRMHEKRLKGYRDIGYAVVNGP